MFVDNAKVVIAAGDGGNGVVSFRHEKFVDRGGPDGGDGGKGGSVIFCSSRNQNTLANFRFQKELVAEDGQSGDKQRKRGRSGRDLIVQVPIGTVVFDEAGKQLVDLSHDGQTAVLAEGGKGGFGNAHFVSSRRQAPKLAEKGERGERNTLRLELKSIADVGIVGLPNAGKSTLLARISNARPEIANYAFTTLTPNLGMVDVDKRTSLLVADVPGLIEGASKGKGLGDEFLRHVERTAVLVHLIDAFEDIETAYNTIQKELSEYQIDLTNRPQLVVLNKTEAFDEDSIRQKLSKLKKLVPKKTKLLTISAVSGTGIQDLLYELKYVVARERVRQLKAQSKNIVPVITIKEENGAWRVNKVSGGFEVTGKKIEKFAERTDFSNPQGVERLHDILSKLGILRELEKQDINPGQTIFIGSNHEYKLEY